MWKHHIADVPELLWIYISVIESKIYLIISLKRKTITGDN